MGCIARGEGCPPHLRHCLPLLAATGCLRRYDGPPMEGMEGRYLMTFAGREFYAEQAGETWIRDRKVEEAMNVG